MCAYEWVRTGRYQYIRASMCPEILLITMPLKFSQRLCVSLGHKSCNAACKSLSVGLADKLTVLGHEVSEASVWVHSDVCCFMELPQTRHKMLRARQHWKHGAYTTKCQNPLAHKRLRMRFDPRGSVCGRVAQGCGGESRRQKARRHACVHAAKHTKSVTKGVCDGTQNGYLDRVNKRFRKISVLGCSG